MVKEKYIFIEYPKCSTCKKAKKWLEGNKIKFEDRNIVENNPTEEELKKWIPESGKDISKWFNTSGMKYRELKLSARLKGMKEEEKIEILASDGMLIKRPILIVEKESKRQCLLGFKIEEWEKLI